MNEYDVRQAFERIELELIESMKRNLGRHLAEEEKEGFRWNMWQEEQLKSLKAYERALSWMNFLKQRKKTWKRPNMRC